MSPPLNPPVNGGRSTSNGRKNASGVVLASALCLCLGAVPARAAFPDGFNHSELNWHELVTQHFRIIYHDGLDETADLVAHIAEASYDRVCDSVGARPKAKTPVVLADYTTQTREFAAPLKHSIWLTGNTVNEARLDPGSWLNLVVHEFAHICTYEKLRGSEFSSFWEWATTPMLPKWFYEGIAESEANRYSQLGYAILRSAILEDNVPPLAALDTGVDRDLKALWLKYAAGQSLVAYMVEISGPDAVREVLDKYKGFPYFDWAIRDVFDMSYADLFREWKAHMRRFYEPQVNDNAPIEGYSTGIDVGLEYVRAARFSPDGKKIAYVGIKDDYEPALQLFVADADGLNRRMISRDVDLYKSVALAWSPDGSKLAYGRHWSTTNGTVRFGIYVRDLVTGEDRRITGDKNALDPAWSPDGRTIACVLFDKAGGAARLSLMDPDGGNVRTLTDGPDMPDCVFRPSWSPDSRSLCLEVVHEGTVNIATIGVDPAAEPLRMLEDDEQGYSRAPDWSPEGTRIAFTSYRTGWPQVYVYDLGSSRLARVTQEEVRAVYDPTWTHDGSAVAVACWGSKRSDVRVVSVASPFETVDAPRPAGPPRYLTRRTMAERFPGVDDASWTTRNYRAFDSLNVYLVRPNAVADPYGSQPAVRVYAQDPLEQHTVAAEITYSRQSRQPGYTLEYTNSQHRPFLYARAYQRASGPRLVAPNQPVIDAESSLVLGARYMRNPYESPLTRDAWSALIAHQDLDVLSAPAGVAARRQSTTYGELHFERYTARPGSGSSSIQLTGRASLPGLSQRSTLYDALLDCERQFTRSGTRRVLSLGLEGRATSFSDRAGNGLRGYYVKPAASYTWRIDDYAWSSPWPNLWLDKIDARVTWEYLASSGAPLLNAWRGHHLRAELIGTGHLTRAWPYTLSLSAEYSPSAPPGAKMRYWLSFTTDSESVFSP